MCRKSPVSISPGIFKLNRRLQIPKERVFAEIFLKHWNARQKEGEK